MPDETVDAVIRKVKALLSRTEDSGCSKDEAANAALKAQALLDEHNLTLSSLTDVEFKQEVADEIVDLHYDRLPTWINSLAASMGKAFECQPLLNRQRAGKPIQVHFIGLKADTAAAIHFFVTFMYRLSLEAEMQHQTKYSYENGRVFKSNFICEAGAHIARRLQENRASNVRALVIRKDVVIKEFVAERWPNIHKGMQSNATHSDAGREAGREYGINCSLQNQLETK